MSDQFQSGLEGTNWSIVDYDLKQLKEYFSKLKFTFIEIRAKEFFLQNLFTPSTNNSNTGDGDKQQLKQIKIQIEPLLKEIKSTCLAISSRNQESAELIDKISSFHNQISQLKGSVDLLLQKEYPPVEYLSVGEGLETKNNLLTQLSHLELSIQQLQDDIELKIGAVAIARHHMLELEREESEYSCKSNEALKARMNGNKEAENIHKWLQEMQSFSTHLMVTQSDLLQVNWDECGERRVSFDLKGKIRIVAEIDPIDFTVKQYDCFIGGRPVELKRFPFQPGDPLGLFVCELIEYHQNH